MRLVAGRAVGAQQVVERSLVAFARLGCDDGVDQYGEGGAYLFGEHRGGRSGQMAARREAHDAHARRIDAVLRGMVADVAQCRFGVFERHLAVSVGQAVFECDDRDSFGREPLAHFVPFARHRDDAVAAARADDDGLSGRLVRRCGIDEELSLIHIFRGGGSVERGTDREPTVDFDGREVAFPQCVPVLRFDAQKGGASDAVTRQQCIHFAFAVGQPLLGLSLIHI